MRTNLVIDSSFMKQAMKATGLSTKKAVVEEGLRLLIKVKGQEGICRLRWKVAWEGTSAWCVRKHGLSAVMIKLRDHLTVLAFLALYSATSVGCDNRETILMIEKPIPARSLSAVEKPLIFQ